MSSKSNGVILLCTGSEEWSMDWDLIGALHRTVSMSDWRWAAAALESGVKEHGREIHTVIFDRSIDAALFLQFQATLPWEFRGDILFIESAQRAFVSSCTPMDGRVLYQLGGHDLDFYIQARFGCVQQEAAPHRLANC